MTVLPERINQLRSALEVLQQSLLATTEDLEEYLPHWKVRARRLLHDLLIPNEIENLAAVSTDSRFKDRKVLLALIADLSAGVGTRPEQFVCAKVDTTGTVNRQHLSAGTTMEKVNSKSVFIVHGHDSLAKEQVARTLQQLHLSPLVLHEQPNQGKTVIEKFERDAATANFAVVLLTPDDLGHPKDRPDFIRPRARQNVILELGYFVAALGRENVCVLKKGLVEEPSDFVGIVYIEMDENGAWKYELAKELRQAGLKVDTNLLT